MHDTRTVNTLDNDNVSGTIDENSRDGANLAENPKNNAAPLW